MSGQYLYFLIVITAVVLTGILAKNTSLFNFFNKKNTSLIKPPKSLADKLRKALPKTIKVEVIPDSIYDIIRLTPPLQARGEKGRKDQQAFFNKYQWSANNFGLTTWFDFMKNKDNQFKKARFEYSQDEFIPLTKESAAFFKGLQIGLKEPYIIVEPEIGSNTDSVLVKRYAYGKILGNTMHK